MKSLQKPKTKKSLAVVFALLLAAFIALCAYVVVTKPAKKDSASDLPAGSSINYNPPTEAEKNDPTIVKTDSSGNTKTPPVSSPPDSPKLEVSFSRVDQPSANQPLAVRTLITGAKSGNCDLTATKAGQTTVAKSTAAVFSVSSATCSFDISANEFSAAGEWSISVIAKSGTNTSQAAVQKVTIIK